MNSTPDLPAQDAATIVAAHQCQCSVCVKDRRLNAERWEKALKMLGGIGEEASDFERVQTLGRSR